MVKSKLRTVIIALSSMAVVTALAVLLFNSPPAFGGEHHAVIDERAKMLQRVEPTLSKAGFVKLPKTIPGPIYATVVGVKDGDTIMLDAYPWPGTVHRTDVRIFGADTPEKRKHLSGCEQEIELGKKASQFVKDRIKPGQTVRLKTIFFGKYAKRHISELEYKSGDEWVSLLEQLLSEGHADVYFGKTKPKSWCPG